MNLPTDINDRVRKALKAGYSPDAIRADIQQKYGTDVNVSPLSGLDKASGAAGKLLSFLGGITGLDKGGESVARLGVQLGHQMGKVGGLDTNRTLQAPEATGKQVVGDILRIGGTAGNLASAPAGVGARIATNAAAAGTLGAGDSLTKGQGAGEAIGSGLTKGAIAGGTTAALAGLGWLFNKLTKDVPTAAYKTSTRVPNRTDTEALLREGVTGNRDQLEQRARSLVDEAAGNIRSNPSAQAASVSGEDIFQYEPLQRIRAQAQRLSDGDAVDSAIMKVMPKPSGKVAEEIPETLAPLRDKIDELVGAGAPPGAVNGLEREYVMRANRVPLLEALAQRQAIDTATPPSVFTERATALGAKAEGEVSNALRRAMSQAAPEIVPELNRQAPALALLKELKAYENAKASPVAYSVGNILQRTLFNPAVATRGAKGAYELGAPFRDAQGSALIAAIKRILEQAGVAGIGNL